MFLAAVLAFGGAQLVAALPTDNNPNNSRRNDAIGFVIGALPSFLPPNLDPPLTSCGFRTGCNTGTPTPNTLRTDPTGCAAGGKRVPPAAAADYAPPPYVKEGETAELERGLEWGSMHPCDPSFRPPFISRQLTCVMLQQPPGPPPGIDAVYSPPPGPPPRAHISLGGFQRGFPAPACVVALYASLLLFGSPSVYPLPCCINPPTSLWCEFITVIEPVSPHWLRFAITGLRSPAVFLEFETHHRDSSSSISTYVRCDLS
ncbi:hypothetical protein B0H19DRAFT_1070187 [Mycena capillaripes]|nr:hypothetical protein B0H19DRAFT_1070187 [Mycena capillaripes]